MSCSNIKVPIIKCVDIPFPRFEYHSIEELETKLKDFSELKKRHPYGICYPLPIKK